MPKYIFKLICILYTLFPLVGQGYEENSNNYYSPLSDKAKDYIIEFDDFPDNSVPDLKSIAEEDFFDDSTPKFKDFESTPDSADTIEKQGALGMDVHGFPSAMINGCVNIISGEYQETITDFSLPGAKSLEMQRFYCGAGCKKHSLLYGWQLSQGAKLLTYQIKLSDYAVIKGSDRHGVRFKAPMGVPLFTCPVSFFKKFVTNCSFGEINAQNNFKNDCIYAKHKTFELLKADQSRYFFVKSSHDPERESSTHAYRLEMLELSDGSSYSYQYSQSFGMPSLISQLDRKGVKIAELKLDKNLNHYQFQHTPELTYRTSTNEELKYRFTLYGDSRQKRAVLTEVEPPHAPKIIYSYESSPTHYKRKRLCKRELPDHRQVKIIYNKNNKVEKLISPAGVNNELVPTHTFSYSKNGDKCFGHVKNALGGVKSYIWNKKEKRLNAIATYDEDKTLIIKEQFYWGDNKNDQSHLTAHIFQNDNGQLISFQKYRYDSYGNITCLSLYGNLTGIHDNSIAIDSNFKSPSKNKCDVYRTLYQYDELKRRISEDNGRILNRYAYFENTNLLSAHYLVYDGRIQIRHFYDYDSSGAVCGKITDNGSAEDANDLSNVSERLLKTIKNTPTGLPEIIREYAFDVPSSQKQLIRKKINLYDIHGWMIAQSIYDNEKNLAYTLEWQYDSHGNVIFKKDALGHITEAKYDANDNLIYEQKPDLAPKFFNYDYMNRLIREEQRPFKGESLTKSYRYDVMGNCIASTNIYGKKTHHKYDAHGRLIKTIYPSINKNHPKPTIKYTRNALGHASSITDANNNTTDIEYNIHGKPILTVFSDGTSERNTYTLWGELADCIKPDGTKIQYTYDPQGRETRKEWFDRNGTSVKSTTKSYNAFHLISEIDGNGSKTCYIYNCAGRLISEKIKKKHKTYAYDSLGRQTTISLSIGDKTSISYIKIFDALDRIVESYILNPNGEITNRFKKRYDAQGNEIHSRKWNQAGRCTTMTQYDSFGRVICITNPLGQSIHTTYHMEESPRKEVTDPFGIKTVTTFDPFGRSILEQCFDSMGKLVEQTEYGYDPNGNKILRRILTDKKPVETHWLYNSLNQLTNSIEAVGTRDQKSVQRSYDSVGHLAKLIKNDGTSLNYRYDGLGRKISLKSSDGSISYKYTYDKNDNLLSAHDRIKNTSIKRTYDDYNQIISDILPHGHKLTYAYDLIGNTEQVTLPDQTRIQYAYQGETPLSIERKGALTYTHVFTEYDRSSNPTHISLPAQAGEVKYEYDLLDRKLAIQSSHWHENLDYDIQLLKKRISHDAFGETVSSFTYDARDQILSENGTAEHAFEYDWQGNPIVYDGHSRKFNACNALIKQKDEQYTYDKNGNRTSDGVNKYRYDPLDQLIEIKSSSGKYHYTYDALGRRVSSAHGKEITYFLWQKQQEIGTINTDGRIQELQVLSPFNQAVAFELKGTLYVPLHDTFGHIRALLDSSGNCVSTYRYSAFGDEQTLGNVLSPWRYSGKRIDAGTGLIYFGKRYYHPKTLCWLTPDPIGDADGPNYYAYVHNNPLYYNDPDGQAAFVLLIPVFSYAFGAAGTTAACITFETVACALLGAATGYVVSDIVQRLDNAVNKEGKNENTEDDKKKKKPPYSGKELGEDPKKSPGEGFEWKGQDPPGGRRGAWNNKKKDESLHPDLDHPPPKKPHWDYEGSNGEKARLNTDGTWEWK